jgi:hypothetical protein
MPGNAATDPSPEPWRRRGLIALIVLCWGIGSLPQLAKYLSGLALLAAAIAGALAVLGIVQLALRAPIDASRRRPIVWLAAFWLVMAALYLALYPLSQRHTLGVGSDAEDALRLAATELTRLHYPYQARTYRGNSITPLPGAVLLALPFMLLDKVGRQNLFWLAVFAAVCARWIGGRMMSLAFLAVMALCDLVSLDQFVTGGDYTVNTWYVCVSVLLFLGASARPLPRSLQLGTATLLGVALSSRMVYPMVFVPLLAAYLGQRQGLRAATRQLLGPILLMIGITLPFYLYDPAHFAPLHVQQKLQFLPHAEAQGLLIGLPALAMLVACAGFLVPLSTARIFLCAGIASGVILLVPSALMLLQKSASPFNWQLLSYANASATLIALWAFHELERLTRRVGEFRRPQPVCPESGPVATQSMRP